MPNAEIFPPEYFRRYDERHDDEFYALPRLVVHIDELAIRTLTALLAKVLPPGGVYLDLMSSWRSHLPAELKPSRVVGLGMNDAAAIALQSVMADIPLYLACQAWEKRPIMMIAEGLQESSVEFGTSRGLLQLLDCLASWALQLRRVVDAIPVAQELLRFQDFLTLHPVCLARHGPDLVIRCFCRCRISIRCWRGAFLRVVYWGVPLKVGPCS